MSIILTGSNLSLEELSRIVYDKEKIELMTACQALDCREIKSSAAIEAVKKEIRKTVKHLDRDRIMTNDINNLTQIIDSDIIPKIVKEFIELR